MATMLVFISPSLVWFSLDEDTPSDGMLKKQKKDPLLEDVDVIDQCQD